MKTERIEFIDLAKGFCIILVVMHHAAMYANIDNFDNYDFLKNCRIPLYFCLSGIFYKTYDGFFDFAKRKINKLLVPFLFFYLVLSCSFPFIFHKLGINCYEGYYGGRNIFYHYFVDDDLWFNGPIWFLLCLFVMNIIYYPIEKYLRNKSVVKLIVTILLGCIGYSMYLFEVRNAFYIGTALTSIPFFAFGSMLRQKTSMLVSQPLKPIYIFSIVLLSIILLFPVSGLANYHVNKYAIPLYLCYYCGIIGTVAILLLAKSLGRLPFISKIGKYSIITLCIHYEIQRFLALLIPEEFSCYLKFSFIFLGSIVICWSFIPFFCKYLPWTVAQKDIIK